MSEQYFMSSRVLWYIWHKIEQRVSNTSIHWPASCTTQSMHACSGWTFWIHAV